MGCIWPELTPRRYPPGLKESGEVVRSEVARERMGCIWAEFIP